MSILQKFLHPRIASLIFAGAFLWGLALLATRPLADPPLLDWSIGAWGDWGIYISDARNLALAGKLRLLEAHSPVTASLFFFAETITFALVGCGRAQSLIVPILAWLLLAGITYSSVKHSPKLMIIACLLVASPLILAGVRSPRGDILSLAIFAAGLRYALDARDARGAFLAGFLLMLAPLAKIHAIVGSASALAGFLIGTWRMPDRRRDIFAALAGAAAAAITGVAIFAFLASMSTDGFSLSALPQLIKFVAGTTAGDPFRPFRFIESTFVIREPALALLGCASVIGLAGEKIGRSQLTLLSPIAAWIVLLAFMPYDPLRYRTPLVMLFAFSAMEFARTDREYSAAAMTGAFGIAMYGLSYWAGLKFFPKSFILSAAAVVVGVFFFLVLKSRGSLRSLFLGAVVIGAILQTLMITSLFLRRGYEIEEATRVVASTLPERVIVAGFWAPLLVMPSDHETRSHVNHDEDGPTHIVDEPGFLRAVPADMEVRVLARTSLPTIKKEIIIGELRSRAPSDTDPMR